jgi:hypothetical protein
MTSRPRRRRAAATGLLSALHLAALAAAKRRVRRHPGVIGVDYGYVYKGGLRTGQIGIRFHVRRKLPLRAIPSAQRLPKQIEGLRTDVIESGFKPHRADPFAQAATLQPGLCVGNVPRRSNGTLGLFVRDRKDGAPCVLSNWHVLCGGTDARPDDEISQPGPLFLGPNPAREIARLRRWISPERQFDAAIAALVAGIQTDATLLDAQVRVVGATEPRLGMTVIKAGMATGITHALVDAVNGHYQVPYDGFGVGRMWMSAIHLVPHPDFHDTEISVAGDSGSAWVEVQSGRAVALNFAGEDDVSPLNEYALAHALPELCDLLECDVAS